MRFKYQYSVYGEPWTTFRENAQIENLAVWCSPMWVRMFPERHHRIFDLYENKVVWEYRSTIAPEPAHV